MENNYRFRIDCKKWKQAVIEVELARENRRDIFKQQTDDYCSKTEGKNGVGILYRQGFNDDMDLDYAKKLTLLYSIRAHARGRIHRKRARVNTDKGQIKYNLTIEDQVAYIGDAWKKYVYQDPIPTQIIEIAPEANKSFQWQSIIGSMIKKIIG
jgi:hypothetical protein